MATRAKVRRVRLKPQDSFDLIRLLATTQADPRKAVAEFVQNSLDAGARNVELLWFNERGRRALRIQDDGAGVFPELEREEALRKIAQTIGHSHKRNLDPGRRRELMMLGQYGIGLLGFWSLGEEMEIRSRVGGGRAYSLRMFRDRRQAEIAPARATRLDDTGTSTVVTVRRLHPVAVRQVRPAKLHPYLARELRGQLLGRDVDLTIRDKVARGLARKHWRVEAKPFLGERIDELATLEVPGHEPARLELYYVTPDEDRDGTVALACGGTIVLDDVAQATGDQAVWGSGRFEGIVDFPDLQVAPGTRRGVVPNDAYHAFLGALATLDRELRRVLADEEARRERERERDVARAIRKAFRSVPMRLPEYDLFDVQGRTALRGQDGAAEGQALPDEQETEDGEQPETGAEESSLYPPGPLAAVRIGPARARMLPGSARAFTARAEDADGRRVRDDLDFEWSLEGPGELTAENTRATYRAPDADAEATLAVVARQGPSRATAEARIQVEEHVPAREVGGIPEPEAVHAPAEAWRSRVRGSAWQYNTGHRDYRAVADVEARRVRYLSYLFAKELVLRNFGRPGDDEVLERLVEVLTYVGMRER